MTNPGRIYLVACACNSPKDLNLSCHCTTIKSRDSNATSQNKILDTVGITKEKVSKVATALSDVWKFFEALRMKYASVWDNVPMASQVYRRTLVQADIGLISGLEGHSGAIFK